MPSRMYKVLGKMVVDVWFDGMLWLPGSGVL